MAAAAGLRRTFIEAGPGSGKTTVAAQLFGAQRFKSTLDDRAVVAVSFTRSATAELRTRIKSTWGPLAGRLPHRICTLDTFVNDMVTYLLTTGEIGWPGGHVSLDVIDDWKTFDASPYSFEGARLTLLAGSVSVEPYRSAERKNRIQAPALTAAITAGVCSHNDIRRVLELYLVEEVNRQSLQRWLQSHVRCIVVDEVFDANQLDVKLLALMAETDIEIVVIGDPWQALYGFRGARPELIPELVAEYDFHLTPLEWSFRFETDEQRELAAKLRTGQSVELIAGDPSECDVVLASQWGHLWGSATSILPTALKSASSTQWAIATLILHAALQVLLGVPALQAKEAFRVLQITDDHEMAAVTSEMDSVLKALSSGSESAALKNAWDGAVTIVLKHSDLLVVGNRAPGRLKPLRARLLCAERIVLGMTVHQAKGHEWDNVGLVLTATELQHLASGLSSDFENDRVSYVALTRARRSSRLISTSQLLSGSSSEM